MKKNDFFYCTHKQNNTMTKFKIRIMNQIAAEGLALFNDKYQLGEKLENPDGIVVRSSLVNTENFSDLLAVSRAGAGVNNITVDKATEQGICIFNTPGANANAVAELVFVMAGLGVRHIHGAMDFCRGLDGLTDKEITAQVEAGKARFRGHELAGKTLGVLGLGQIGVRVANRGVRQQMKTIGFDPMPALENIHRLSAEVIFSRSLSEVVSQANVLTIHMPYNDKTRGLINAELLAKLPDKAILLNYARGEIVDNEAVLAALDSGKLSCFITDFPDSRVLGHARVIATPHLGASTAESEEHCATMAVRELKDYLEYGTVSRSVNFPTAESIPGDSVHTRLIMINHDTPGMIGFASQTLGAHSINIASYLNESNGKIGYNIIDLQSPLPLDVLAEINAHPGVIRTRIIPFHSH
jgi:D-3-phosphoglycerate dehydrogenase